MKSVKFFTVFTFLLAFAVCVSAQTVLFPNEVKGYEFFGNGKLKELRLTVSSKDDVKRIFGEKCKKKCNYDSNWLIAFEYYEDIWIKQSRNEKDEKLTYYLDSKYLGKLRSVEIRPKKQISFADISFSKAFQKLQVNSNGAVRSDKRRMSGDKAFQDSRGLTYEIYNGDLVLIRYDISKDLEKDLFVLQK